MPIEIPAEKMGKLKTNSRYYWLLSHPDWKDGEQNRVWIPFSEAQRLGNLHYTVSYDPNQKHDREDVDLVKNTEFDQLTHMVPASEWMEANKNKIIVGDCMDVFKNVPDETFDLIFNDPPFNLDKEYNSDYSDSKSMSVYQKWCREWMAECWRVLKPGGVLVIHNIPLHAMWMGAHLLKSGWSFQNWVAWKAYSGFPAVNRMSPDHYAFLVFSKGNPNTYNLKGDLVPHEKCRHCGGYVKDYGGKEKYRDPMGKKVTDMWIDISRVNHNSRKVRGANQLPVEIVTRFIRLYTNIGDSVADMFMGSGTTAEAAMITQRKYFGVELSDQDTAIAMARLKSVTIPMFNSKDFFGGEE